MSQDRPADTPEPTPEAAAEQAVEPRTAPTVPLRDDGWPDWLGRRPMSAADRDKLAQVLAEPVPATPGTDPGPFLCI